MRHRLTLIWLILPVIVLGCTISKKISTIPPSPTTIVPSTAVSSTRLFTPGYVSTATMTHTFIPTVSADIARQNLLTLLKNNGQCKLPCLWGITPGKTLIYIAESVLVPFSSISYYTDIESNSGRISPEYKFDNLILSTKVDYSADSKTMVINNISFSIGAIKEINNSYEDIYNSTKFGEYANVYMLSNVLAEYGPPESVRIATQAKESSRDNAGGGFYILLLYPEKGISALYTMQLQIAGTNVRGCPSNAHVKFELYSPNHRVNFLDALDKISESQAYPTRHLQDVTSLSLDEFYQIFRKSKNECLETPSGLWPMPEP